jgi:hypothetical protein
MHAGRITRRSERGSFDAEMPSWSVQSGAIRGTIAVAAALLFFKPSRRSSAGRAPDSQTDKKDSANLDGMLNPLFL